eukprot:8332847-Alexandrium_andersonii.AAC.1
MQSGQSNSSEKRKVSCEPCELCSNTFSGADFSLGVFAGDAEPSSNAFRGLWCQQLAARCPDLPHLKHFQ